MKKYLLSLFCAALAGTAWAQGPALIPATTGSNNITQVGGIFSGKTAACAKDCGPQTKTVCVSLPATVVKTKVLFSSGCETVCSKGICQLLKKGGDCDSCQADGSCGLPYVKRDLYKRVEKTECPSTKCVPTLAPACPTAPCATPCAAPCTTKCANGTCTPVAFLQGAQANQAPTMAALAINTPMPTATPVAVRPTLGFVPIP